MWNKEKCRLIFTFSGEGFSGVHGWWGVNNLRCFIVNIYSPCSMEGKGKLWDNLRMSKKGFGNEVWILAGDFNAVLKVNERKGFSSHVNRAEIEEFQSFVKDMNLTDLPLLGRRFTWFNSNGSTMSRLDIFLVSEDCLKEWPNPVTWALNRDLSDHCPLILR